ncbi:MAG TPA: glycosyltransferase family 1 protein [Caldilineae bacterium]|nr:glycosyltransferase family 1 protein [Caldilineae bacterium]
MKLLGRISVFPAVPERIGRLNELAYNLWWIWHPKAQALYRLLDPELWEQVDHNPVKLLREVMQDRLNWAAADPDYLALYDKVMGDLDAYMHPSSTWFSQQHPDSQDELIAYFSAEFGLHEALPIYSGGLGVLSGDHCKTASDLGIPLVGVGFLYPQGYFRQLIDASGWQQARYEKINFSEVPARPALDANGQQIMISVELPGRTIYARVWHFQVGRVSLYLLDTDVAQNAPADRELFARLYAGDKEMRISQEVMLGIGGVRALRALGLHPTVWHMNEGHSAFLVLERVRELIAQGVPFAAACEAVKASTVFTTHTPVPAGHDAFGFDLMDRYFGHFWPQLGIDRETFLNLGRYDYPWGPQFSMTVLALRMSGRRNGVSQLHGAVSRRMWQSLWPGTPVEEVPIGAITNGIHVESWLAPEMAALYDRYLPPDWRDRLEDPETWKAILEIPDEELWMTHVRLKHEMIDFIRDRVRRQRLRHGSSMSQVAAAAELLDPNALTIGFARRFATYKRATLIFWDLDRLRGLLNNPNRPVQIIFAGKAHPADDPGKKLIQQIHQLSQQADFLGRIIFVEDYDLNIARHLVQGVDLWLNTPRRPNEASGTSGQKAAINGLLNCSTLDGWWPEGYNGANGWAFGETRELSDPQAQDEADALALYAVLEHEVIPLFYERDEAGVPRGWVRRMKEAIRSVTPRFNTRRMLREYLQEMYLPTAAHEHALSDDGFALAKALAAWRERVTTLWPQVSVTAQGPQDYAMTLGEAVEVTAEVDLGELSPDEVVVELVYGPRRDDTFEELKAVPMSMEEALGEGRYRYWALLRPHTSGNYAYGVRVMPTHQALPDKFDVRLVRWA